MPSDDPARGGGGDLAELIDRIQSTRGEHARLLAEIADSERRFRSLARRVWRVQEEERRRLARELHDGLGQVLTALKNELDHLASSGAPVSRERLRSGAALAAEALASTRELSRLLRPSMLDDLGLGPALRWLGRSLGPGGFEVAVELAGVDEGERLPDEIETLLFRVAQEALANASRHSGSRQARLELVRRRRSVALTVADTGRGCDPRVALAPSEGSGGLGLRSMRDRVDLHGGRFDLLSAPGAGTTVTVEVPLDEKGGGE